MLIMTLLKSLTLKPSQHLKDQVKTKGSIKCEENYIIFKNFFMSGIGSSESDENQEFNLVDDVIEGSSEL